MTNKQHEKINNWLAERKEVYVRFAVNLGAEYDYVRHIWLVPEKSDDGTVQWIDLTDSSLKDTPDAIQLIVNHAYYLGCLDGVHASIFGVD